MSTRTTHETARPWTLVEMVDGRFEYLQFARVETDNQEFLAHLQDVLTRVMADHSRALVTEFRAQIHGSDDARDRVVAWAQGLANEPVESTSPRVWFPQRADGRDPSGRVHVSIRGDRLALVECPHEDLQAPTKASLAIVAALNQALERHDEDVVTWARRRTVGFSHAADPTAWTELARRAQGLPSTWA